MQIIISRTILNRVLNFYKSGFPFLSHFQDSRNFNSAQKVTQDAKKTLFLMNEKSWAEEGGKTTGHLGARLIDA